MVLSSPLKVGNALRHYLSKSHMLAASCRLLPQVLARSDTTSNLFSGEIRRQAAVLVAQKSLSFAAGSHMLTFTQKTVATVVGGNVSKR